MKKLITFLILFIVSTITFSQTQYYTTITNIVKLNDTTILCIGDHNIMQDSILSARFEYNLVGDDVIYTKPCTTFNFSVEIYNLPLGSYEFRYVVKTSLGDIYSTSYDFINTSSIKDVEISNIKVYPNPFTDYIIFNGITQKEGFIYNMTGKLVKNIILIPNQKVNINLPIGDYILKSDNIVIKLVKI